MQVFLTTVSDAIIQAGRKTRIAISCVSGSNRYMPSFIRDKTKAPILCLFAAAAAISIALISSTKPMSALDRKVYECNHYPGLKGFPSYDELPIALEILDLPPTTELQRMAEIVYARIKVARDLKMTAEQEQLHVLQSKTKLTDEQRLERIKIVGSMMVVFEYSNSNAGGCHRDPPANPIRSTKD